MLTVKQGGFPDKKLLTDILIMIFIDKQLSNDKSKKLQASKAKIIEYSTVNPSYPSFFSALKRQHKLRHHLMITPPMKVLFSQPPA